MDLFSGLIKGALDATASGRRGIEETAAAVTTLFLDGARASSTPPQFLLPGSGCPGQSAPAERRLLERRRAALTKDD